MKLTDDEHTVVKCVYGEEIPANLGEVETDQLLTMHTTVSRAIETAYEEPEGGDLDILLQLERKIIEALHEQI